MLLVLPFLDLLPEAQWSPDEGIEQEGNLLFLVESSQREIKLCMLHGMQMRTVHTALQVEHHQVNELIERLADR